MSKKIRTFFSPGSEPGEKGFPPSVTDQSADVSAGALIAKYVRSGVSVPDQRYDAQTLEDAAGLVVSAMSEDGFDLADVPAVLKSGAAAVRAANAAAVAAKAASAASSAAAGGGTTPPNNPTPAK